VLYGRNKVTSLRVINHTNWMCCWVRLCDHWPAISTGLHWAQAQNRGPGTWCCAVYLQLSPMRWEEKYEWLRDHMLLRMYKNKNHIVCYSYFQFNAENRFFFLERCTTWKPNWAAPRSPVSYTPPHVARDSLGTPYNPWGLLGDSLGTPYNPWGLLGNSLGTPYNPWGLLRDSLGTP
jgi:hypothetical protein